ncbi:MAG: glycerol-3-phosphate acyltransferase [Trueperaceae bacterium]|nr:glycerol-3-phosphate acyltransferase [Trueperaceae bacterium]
MEPVVVAVLTALLGYAIGSLPLGGLLVKRVTGRHPRDFDSHLLGVENVFRLAGAPVAVASFGLDVLKGLAALSLTAASPWAALGVYLGHLHPVPWPRPLRAHRGRGNGVLLGILAGWAAFGAPPWWALAVPVWGYAAVLVATRYVAVATATGLVLLPLALAAVGAGLASVAAAVAITAAGLWRQKSGIARVRDRTEARLGDPPPVRGLSPDIVLAAFMVHPMTVDDLWQPPSQRWLGEVARRGWLPEALLRRVLLLMRPQIQGEIKGIELADGRQLRVLLLSGPMLPDQIRAYPEIAVRMAIQGAQLARDCGAEAFGLGAFWSTVGEKGLKVQEAVPDIAITNGGAYTAATVRAAIPGLLARFAASGGTLANACAAVVGANGVVAFGVARMIAGDVGRLVLIGRDMERLERSAATLRKKFTTTEIVCSLDINDCASADLVFTATSDPKPVLFPEHVKPGAWIFDIGRPADVDESVRDVPGVRVIPGGVVRPPGSMHTGTDIDLHLGDARVFACMAETMIMTAARSFDRASLGPQTRSADIEYYLHEGERLGFTIVTDDEFAALPLA